MGETEAELATKLPKSSARDILMVGSAVDSIWQQLPAATIYPNSGLPSDLCTSTHFWGKFPQCMAYAISESARRVFCFKKRLATAVQTRPSRSDGALP